MPRLLIVSLGALGGALLEATARDGHFDEIVVATRNVEHAQRKANNARVGAALEGRFPRISVVAFDLNAGDAGERLAGIGPDVAFAAPSMLPWWRLNSSGPQRATELQRAPFATFTACHLAPMLALRDAWATSGLASPWIGASYPDVVNHVLACTGATPTCGAGNLLEAVPKIQLVVARELALEPAAVQVRLVAQHAFEYFCYSDGAHARRPPYLLQALYGDRDASEIARAHLFEPFPIPYQLDLNRVTASATLPVLKALGGETPIATHVPAPHGRLGGYPVTVCRRTIELDLAPEWTLQDAEAVNRDSLPFDGIESITDDGTVHFTDETCAALASILDRAVHTMSPDEAPALADELVQRLTQ